MTALLRTLAILALLPLNVPAFAGGMRQPPTPVPTSDAKPKHACKCCQGEKANPSQNEGKPAKPRPKSPLPAKPCCPHCCAVCSGSAIVTHDQATDLCAEHAPPAWIATPFTSVPHAGHRSLPDRPPRS